MSRGVEGRESTLRLNAAFMEMGRVKADIGAAKTDYEKAEALRKGLKTGAKILRDLDGFRDVPTHSRVVQLRDGKTPLFPVYPLDPDAPQSLGRYDLSPTGWLVHTDYVDGVIDWDHKRWVFGDKEIELIAPTAISLIGEFLLKKEGVVKGIPPRAA